MARPARNRLQLRGVTARAAGVEQLPFNPVTIFLDVGYEEVIAPWTVHLAYLLPQQTWSRNVSRSPNVKGTSPLGTLFGGEWSRIELQHADTRIRRLRKRPGFMVVVSRRGATAARGSAYLVVSRRPTSARHDGLPSPRAS